MTDISVTSARRVALTFLSLAMFVALVHRGYWISSDYVYEELSFAFFSTMYIDQSACMAPFVGGALALTPIVFLSLSISNQPVLVRSGWIWRSGLLFFGTVVSTLWLGRVDAESCLAAYYAETAQLPAVECPAELTGLDRDRWELKRELSWVRSIRQRFLAGLPSLPERQEISWFSLVIPTVLTSAFVVTGAWRWS